MSVRWFWALSVAVLVALGGSARADAITTANPNIWFSWGFKGLSLQGAAPAVPSMNVDPPQPIAVTTAASAPVAAAQVVTSAATAATTSTAAPVDAYINFGGPAPEQSTLTTGTAQPWYDSPAVKTVFGGVPTLSQQTSFVNQVFQDVEQTFHQSGLNPSLTLDPNTPALHTLSVVSGLSSITTPGAIGITDVGHDGFSLIDHLSYATQGQVSQLEWAVAHNISHELMHAFGVAVHHDQTGQYLDAASASWNVLTNPGTTFSQAAVNDIQSHLNGTASASGTGSEDIDGDEMIVAPVPEPATIALWSLGAAALLLYRRRRPLRAA